MMSAFQKFLMLTPFVYLASATTTTTTTTPTTTSTAFSQIKEKKWMKIHVEEDSWVRSEITSLESHGSLNGWVSF